MPDKEIEKEIRKPLEGYLEEGLPERKKKQEIKKINLFLEDIKSNVINKMIHEINRIYPNKQDKEKRKEEGRKYGGVLYRAWHYYQHPGRSYKTEQYLEELQNIKDTISELRKKYFHYTPKGIKGSEITLTPNSHCAMVLQFSLKDIFKKFVKMRPKHKFTEILEENIFKSSKSSKVGTIESQLHETREANSFPVMNDFLMLFEEVIEEVITKSKQNDSYDLMLPKKNRMRQQDYEIVRMQRVIANDMLREFGKANNEWISGIIEALLLAHGINIAVVSDNIRKNTGDIKKAYKQGKLPKTVRKRKKLAKKSA